MARLHYGTFDILDAKDFKQYKALLSSPYIVIETRSLKVPEPDDADEMYERPDSCYLSLSYIRYSKETDLANRHKNAAVFVYRRDEVSNKTKDKMDELLDNPKVQVIRHINDGNIAWVVVLVEYIDYDYISSALPETPESELDGYVVKRDPLTGAFIVQ